MSSPSTFPYESNNLRAFIRSTSLSSIQCQLAYVPPSEPQATPITPSKSATLTRSPSPYPRPAPLRRTASFANLLNVFRRPSLSFSSETLSTQAGGSVDLDDGQSLVDPYLIRYSPSTETRRIPSSKVELPPTYPTRSSSLGWLQDFTCEQLDGEDTRSVFTLQLYQDDTEEALELEVAAELRETFKEWEERFGLRQEPRCIPNLEPVSPDSALPTSPAYSQLLTPASTLYDSFSPLRSRFSCDSIDEERAAVLDLVRGRDMKSVVSPGSIGRLTRKMSKAIALSMAHKSPLGRRMGLGRRDTA